MSRLTLSHLRAARRAKQPMLRALPGVVGTGLGVKRQSGERVDTSSLIVFVERKVPVADLPRAARIPKFVYAGGKKVPTDVVQINAVRPEFGSAPYFISDFIERGVVSAFGFANGQFYLVTCAHCLIGVDKNPYSASPVGIWAGPDDGYLVVGETVYAVNSPGFGRPGDFGFMDAGFAHLSHPEILRRARRAPLMAIASSARRGQLLAADGPNGPMVGEIDGFEVEIFGQRADVLLHVGGTGTYPGYSGMMWRAQDGGCVAMHAFGAQFTPIGGSRYSLAVSAKRVAAELQLTLLVPV
jgi:hypothetical protein